MLESVLQFVDLRERNCVEAAALDGTLRLDLDFTAPFSLVRRKI